MIRLRTVAIAAGWTFWAATASLAQSTANVLSGEHDSFSRLAVRLLPDEKWTVTRKGSNVVILRLDGQGPDLDVADVFDLIPRSRIASVSAEGRSMTLRLACRCAVETFRTENGFLAVDVGQRLSGPPPALQGPSIELPLVLEAGSILTAPLVVPDPEPEPVALPLAAPQFTIHEQRPTDLLPHRQTQPTVPTESPERACRFEPMARRAFDAAPEEALAALPGSRADVLNGEDAFDRSRALALVDQYLAIGWGAEALAILDDVIETDPDRRTLATAFDHMGYRERDDVALPQPACGPASAIAFLMLGGTADGWRTADETAALTYLDRLPPLRRAALLPQVRAGLTAIGREDRLVGISRAVLPSDEGASHPVEAGTDLAAIRSLRARLKNANERLDTVDDIWLVNTVAVLPSLPDGELREGIERELVKSLILARHFSDAERVVGGDAGRAAEAIRLALDALPPEDAVEAIVRLAPLLEPDAPVASRARGVLMSYGLAAMATSVPSPPRPSESVDIGPDAIRLETPEDPWLARDLRQVIAAEEGTDPARQRIADAIVTRNRSTQSVGDDYDQAGRELDRSRKMRAALEALLHTEPAL